MNLNDLNGTNAGRMILLSVYVRVWGDWFWGDWRYLFVFHFLSVLVFLGYVYKVEAGDPTIFSKNQYQNQIWF